MGTPVEPAIPAEKAEPTAEEKIDYFEKYSKENPELAKEIVEIAKNHPEWRGPMWGNEARMRWILDHAEEYLYAAARIMDFVDKHPKLTTWAWIHPYKAKLVIEWIGKHPKIKHTIKEKIKGLQKERIKKEIKEEKKEKAKERVKEKRGK